MLKQVILRNIAGLENILICINYGKKKTVQKESHEIQMLTVIQYHLYYYNWICENEIFIYMCMYTCTFFLDQRHLFFSQVFSVLMLIIMRKL